MIIIIITIIIWMAFPIGFSRMYILLKITDEDFAFHSGFLLGEQDVATVVVGRLIV